VFRGRIVRRTRPLVGDRLVAQQVAHGFAHQEPTGDQLAVAARLGILELRSRAMM
jgi:hypothetical protein